MPRHAAKKQEDKRRLTPNGTPALQTKGASASRLTANRTAQAYQEMADNSPRVKQLKAYQAIADHSKTAGLSSAGVVQLHLADDLNSKKVNVAIAGEQHGEIPDDVEQGAWGKAGITVHYEADSIPLNDQSGPDVTPDPLKLRLGFAYTALKEYTSPYLEASFKPGQSKDVAGAKDARDVIKYLLPVLINDLSRVPQSEAERVQPVIAALTELRSLLRGNKLTKVVGDELARVSLSSKVRRNLEVLGKFASDVHSKSAFKAVEFKSVPLRVARSEQMLDRINKTAGSLDNIIYKVGNRHVEDMEQAKWVPGPKVAVLERAKYLGEFHTLDSRGGVPVSVPVQSPAKPPVSSEPKRKPKPKVVKPQVAVKTAADVKVERLQTILNAAPADVREAKGYIEIAGQLAHYKMRLESDDIIRNVKAIIEERNDRWEITKFIFRSKETQQLYDDLAAEIG